MAEVLWVSHARRFMIEIAETDRHVQNIKVSQWTSQPSSVKNSIRALFLWMRKSWLIGSLELPSPRRTAETASATSSIFASFLHNSFEAFSIDVGVATHQSHPVSSFFRILRRDGKDREWIFWYLALSGFVILLCSHSELEMSVVVGVLIN